MRFKIGRWLWRPVEFVLAAALKTVMVGVVFVACTSAALHWLGYHVPGLSQLREYLGGVRYLSDLLS